MQKKSAIRAINEGGILLVFPIENRKDVPSLWSHFYPRTKMRWEWDDSGDNRVADLWHLREKLSTSNEVIYVKWFRGRATFFSKEVFVAMMKLLNPAHQFSAAATVQMTLGSTANRLLEALELESPLSTKQLKRAVDLTGKLNESTYTRGMKELWDRLLIVAYGEVDEGAFPSLAVGSTHNLFEELYREARVMDETRAFAVLKEKLPAQSPFLEFFSKVRKKCIVD